MHRQLIQHAQCLEQPSLHSRQDCSINANIGAGQSRGHHIHRNTEIYCNIHLHREIGAGVERWVVNERRGSDIQRPTSHPWLQLTIALGLITPTKIQSTVLLEGEHLWTSGLAMRRKLMPSGNENRTVGLNVSSTPADFTTARTVTC